MQKKNPPTAKPHKNAAAPTVTPQIAAAAKAPPKASPKPAPEASFIGSVRLGKEQLAEIVGVMRHVATNRSTLPILSYLLITSQDGKITVQATDLDTYATLTIPPPPLPATELARKVLLARFERENGAFLVPIDMLRDIAKAAAKNDAVILTGFGGKGDSTPHQVTASYVVNGALVSNQASSLPVKEFPEFTIRACKFIEETVVTDSMLQAFRHAMMCSSDDGERYILQSAAMDASDKNHHVVVGTDGRRMYCHNSQQFPFQDVRMLPATPLTRPFAGPLTVPGWKISFGDPKDSKNETKRVRLDAGDWEFIIRGIEGNYPNWRQVLPKMDKPPTKFTLTPEARAFILKTLPAVPAEQKKQAESIALQITDSLAIKRGHSVIPIPGAVVTGKALTIRFAPEFFIDALRAGMSDFRFSDDLSAGVFSDGPASYVLMPMRDK